MTDLHRLGRDLPTHAQASHYFGPLQPAVLRERRAGRCGQRAIRVTAEGRDVIVLERVGRCPIQQSRKRRSGLEVLARDRAGGRAPWARTQVAKR